MKNLLYIITFFLLTNCYKKEKDLDFEKSVMNEIFMDIVNDSGPENFPPPKPPPPNNIPVVYYTLDSKIRRDSFYNSSTNETKLEIKNYEIIKKKIKEDYNKHKLKNNILVAINDTIRMVNHEVIKRASTLSKIDFCDLSKSDSIEYKIDLEQFNYSKKYNLKYRTEFPENNNIWKWNRENEKKLKGIISFSRIIFNKEKTYGFLTSGISHGKLNGDGGIYIIKKVNGKWIILNYYGIWIS